MRWGAFLLVAGALLGLLYGVREGRVAWALYAQARLAFWSVTALVTLWRAFFDSSPAGWACVLLPPYLVYYGLERADFFWLRGALLALLLSLPAEWHFARDRALVTRAQVTVNRWIESGHGAIRRAGAEDLMLEKPKPRPPRK